MKFSSLSLLSIVAVANAAKQFGLLTLHSGTSFQFQSVSTLDNGDLGIVSSTDGKFVLNDDGSLLDFNGKQVGTTSSGIVTSSDQKQSVSTDFGLDGDDLTFGGKQIFVACPNADKNGYLLSVGSCDGSVGIVLRATDIADVTVTQPPPPPPPQGNDCPSFAIQASSPGTRFDCNSIFKVDSHPHVFSVGGNEGVSLVVTFYSDGTSLFDTTGRGVYVDPSTGEVGNVDPWGQQSATKGFSISGDHLVFNGDSCFYACPSGGDRFSLSKNSCIGGTQISLVPSYVQTY